MVQVSQNSGTTTVGMKTNEKSIIGLIAVIVSCITSGFAVSIRPPPVENHISIP